MKVRTEMGHFWITFDNGYTLSVFNGYGSHTENHFAIEKWQDIRSRACSFLSKRISSTA